MTIEDMQNLFNKYEKQYLKNENLAPSPIARLDLRAFILLNELVPGTDNIVGAVEKDEMYLGVDIEQLAKVITEEQVLELIRCGIRFESDLDSLMMLV